MLRLLNLGFFFCFVLFVIYLIGEITTITERTCYLLIIFSFQRAIERLNLSKLNRYTHKFTSLWTWIRFVLYNIVSVSSTLWCFLRKEVIHPHVPVGIPCYDLTPITSPTLGGSLPYGLGHRLRVLPALMVWRAVCTRPGNVFTATWLICDY